MMTIRITLKIINIMKNSHSYKSLQAYFTDADDIRSTMIQLLGDTTGKTVLEPCFGEGAFIKNFIGQPKQIDAIDIDINHFDQKLDIENCDYYNFDFIDYFIYPENRDEQLPNIKYDSTICNPPYGLKFSLDYRKQIKNKYPEVYARESYGLFFYFAIRLLRENGSYVFIIPDSFMTSRNLSYLRKFIIYVARPTHIIQFKSKRFGSVNFGYGNMCIIAGHKKTLHDDDKITWIDATLSDRPLNELLKDGGNEVDGRYLIKNHQNSWVHPTTQNSVTFNRPTVTLDDLAFCKTGIYTGNNKEFCGYDISNPPNRINGHAVNWKDSVVTELTLDEIEYGLDRDIGYVPFIRGGHRAPFETANSCVKWDKESVDFYNKDKKARLQNKGYYFKVGLAVPMVTSGRLSASEMSGAIFDQGVVGVFPKNEEYYNFLLIFLNHSIASDLKKIVAPGANNSANYLKRILVPCLTSEELNEASEIISRAKNIGWNATELDRNVFINKVT